MTGFAWMRLRVEYLRTRQSRPGSQL